MTRCSLPCALLMLIAPLSAGAQAPITIGVQEGTAVRTIARQARGEWVGATSCVPRPEPAGTAGRERLVVSGGPRPLRLRALVPGEAEWVRLSPAILEIFDSREREQRLTRAETSDAPRAVDWIYAAEANGERTYYFEVSRRVAPSYENVDADTDPPGTLRISVAGFLRDEATAGPASIGTKSELRWEEDGMPAGPPRPDLTPLGVFQEGDRSSWVMRGHSGTSTWLTMYELRGESIRTVLTIRGPRC